MECEKCEGQYCCTCLGMSDEVYEYMCMDSVLWCCQACYGDVRTLIDENKKNEAHGLFNIEGKMVKMEARIIEKLDKIATDVMLNQEACQATLLTESEVNDEKGDEGEAGASELTYAKVAARPATKVPCMKGIMKEALLENEKEIQEKEDRAKNIILFGVEESGESDRKKREEEDKKFIADFLNELGVNDMDFEKAIRLGKREEGKKRPLRFTVNGINEKSKIMDSLYLLRESDRKFSSVSVRHDLTIAQRQEFKVLVESAKQKTEESDGSFLFRVRCGPGAHWKPRIVKLRAKTN